ncbi:MAG: hypothetical protein QXQ11_04685 [Candidatus Bathyarchaeia archaeon]
MHKTTADSKESERILSLNHKSPAKKRRDHERAKQRRSMWIEAYRDRNLKEIISTRNYEIHPTIPVSQGDVLISGTRYIHPALTKTRPTTNIHRRKYWADIITKLPKMKVRESSE